MGNTCCADSDKDNSNQSVSLRNFKAAEVETNGPPATVANKVDKMNVMNPAVKKVHTELGIPSDFNPIDSNPEDHDVRGPFKYSDGATYVGQYENGLRQGVGRIVSILMNRKSFN
jgi:hypothetical protein